MSDYSAVYPDPIAMLAGETVQVGKRDPENEAWVWCTGRSGKSGWAPVAYIEQTGSDGIARCDYAATELSVSAGEELEVSNEESGWVWATNGQGGAGWLPSASVEEIP